MFGSPKHDKTTITVSEMKFGVKCNHYSENWAKIESKLAKKGPGGVALVTHRRHLGFLF
jgi:hypothetical protein